MPILGNKNSDVHVRVKGGQKAKTHHELHFKSTYTIIFLPLEHESRRFLHYFLAFFESGYNPVRPKFDLYIQLFERTNTAEQKIMELKTLLDPISFRDDLLFSNVILCPKSSSWNLNTLISVISGLKSNVKTFAKSTCRTSFRHCSVIEKQNCRN